MHIICCALHAQRFTNITLDYWSETNKNAYYPKPYLNGSTQKNQQTQTRYLQSAAYMRCKNIQLGYTLPQAITEKAGRNHTLVGMTLKHLLYISLSNECHSAAQS